MRRQFVEDRAGGVAIAEEREIFVRVYEGVEGGFQSDDCD